MNTSQENNIDKKKCVGIDLGTTYSSISWFDTLNNRVDTIDLNSADGAKVLRSVVFYPENGEPVVGEVAMNSAKENPDRVIIGIKRSMGTDYKTQPIDGKEYTPAEVSSHILQVLVKDAQAYLGEEVGDVVITVPAYFGDAERAMTEEAGKLAGLNVRALLPEPHAAALAYSIDQVVDIIDKYLLVYDLGGGTFDVTLIHVTTSNEADNSINLKIETIFKEGNAHLGGLDWDRALAEIVKEKILEDTGEDITNDFRNEVVLMDNCEKGKRQLSRISPVKIIGDLYGHQAEVTISDFEDRTNSLLLETQALLEVVLEEAEKKHGITKDKIDVLLTGGSTFEDRTSSLLDETQALLEDVLDKAEKDFGITRDKIDVLLTGGSTRMPMVPRMIEKVMGKPPVRHRNPELLVTIGAAYWAHILTSTDAIVVKVPNSSGDPSEKKVNIKESGLTDTISYSVGIEILRYDAQGQPMYVNDIILKKNSTAGEYFEKTYYLSENNMTEIQIVLYKGESSNPDECEKLCDFMIAGLPGGPTKGHEVRVRIGFNSLKGIIEGDAIYVPTGKKADISIARPVS